MTIIGVTPRYRAKTTETDNPSYTVTTTYIEHILELGFSPVVLPTNDKNIEKLLDLCDGFLITGGADSNPIYYGEELDPATASKVSIAREEFDIQDQQIINHAVKHKKPLLGICRGHQSINIFLGGTLYQHIENHTGVRQATQLVHTLHNRLVEFDPIIYTNSYHHQAIKKLAPQLVEIATASDGTNEAVIHRTLPIIGIQWHPEMYPRNEMQPMASSTAAVFDAYKKLFQ